MRETVGFRPCGPRNEMVSSIKRNIVTAERHRQQPERRKKKEAGRLILSAPGSEMLIRLAAYGKHVSLGRVLVQRTDQPVRGGWHRDFATENLVAVDAVAVHGAVATLIRLDDSAVQADACEHTVRARVRENFGSQSDVGVGLRVASHWSGRDGSITAEFEL